MNGATNADDIEAELRRILSPHLGEPRVRELAGEIRATASEIALLYAASLELEDGDPDFTRRLA